MKRRGAKLPFRGSNLVPFYHQIIICTVVIIVFQLFLLVELLRVLLRDHLRRAAQLEQVHDVFHDHAGQAELLQPADPRVRVVVGDVVHHVEDLGADAQIAEKVIVGVEPADEEEAVFVRLPR